MKFKIGDKVKLNPQYEKVWTFFKGLIGAVVAIDQDHVVVKMPKECKGYLNKDGTFPFKPDEIKPAIQPGEQLLLFEL